jgi:hypothetical protein
MLMAKPPGWLASGSFGLSRDSVFNPLETQTAPTACVFSSTTSAIQPGRHRRPPPQCTRRIAHIASERPSSRTRRPTPLPALFGVNSNAPFGCGRLIGLGGALAERRRRHARDGRRPAPTPLPLCLCGLLYVCTCRCRGLVRRLCGVERKDGRGGVVQPTQQRSVRVVRRRGRHVQRSCEARQ